MRGTSNSQLSVISIASTLSVACYSGAPEREQFTERAATNLVAEVRQLAADRGIEALESAPDVRPELVELGRMLAFDKELSGNRDISCMTCHQPELGTGDARNLSIGQGATGLGKHRVHPEGAFIARNAPPLFNLHVMESLFWDGRVQEQSNGDVTTPAGAQVTGAMQEVFEFGAISAVGLFPVVSREEMRAFSGNELAAISDGDFAGVWSGIMDRLGDIPQYVALFEAAYPGTEFESMTFAHASNAIGGFVVAEFSFTNTPWDEFLRGDDSALKLNELKGARNFLSARCSICHSGDELSDQGFHNVALAQFGPGVLDGDDRGRFDVSLLDPEQFSFRTTPLRNVELTGPYGHAGQFKKLKDFLEHYSESDLKLLAYDDKQIEPALRPTILDNYGDILATRDPLLDGVVLPKEFVKELEFFMKALTDPDAKHLEGVRPSSVPSGLSVD